MERDQAAHPYTVHEVKIAAVYGIKKFVVI